jgi:hypothetical protein
VKPWNTCGPGLSHEIASSIKALRDIKGGNGFYIFKGHTSTANIVNQEQQKAPGISQGSRIIGIQFDQKLRVAKQHVYIC